MAHVNDHREAYRCAVSPENAAAQIKVRGRSHLAAVLDTSRDGFTVRVENALLKKLSDGGEYELLFGQEHWRVRKEAHYSDGDFTNVGFARLEDISKVEKPDHWWSIFAYKRHVDSDPAFLLYMMLVFLFACVALPGMGDSLGTAPRIKKGVEIVWDAAREVLQQVF